MEFFQEIASETTIFFSTGKMGILLTSLLAGLLATVSCGIVGTYVVTRRITYLAGGIAHCVLGGIGAAVYFEIDPIAGALIAALLSAMVIGIVSLRFSEREDTVISAMWALGMASGIIFISRTPGYQHELMGYLFGDILMVSARDLYFTLTLDIIVVLVTVVLYRKFLAICFDEEFARVRGLRTEWYYMGLLVMTALTVVVLTSLFGVIMVIAMLTIPPAIASRFANRLWSVMAISALLGMVFTTTGLGISYSPDLPSGPTIIVLAAGVYLLTLPFKKRGKTRSGEGE